MNGEQILNEVRLLINNNQYARYNEINRAYRRLAHLAPYSWLKEEDEQRLSFENGESEYTLNITGIRRIIGIWVYGTESGRIRWHFIEEVDDKLFEIYRAQHINLDGDDRKGEPEYFKILSSQPGQIKIRVTPSPDAAVDVKISYIKEVEDIDRNTVPEMPAAYHDLIAQLAAGYVLRIKNNQLGQLYIAEAIQQATNMMMDSSANRTLDVDRPKRPWIRSNQNRYGNYSGYGIRHRRW